MILTAFYLFFCFFLTPVLSTGTDSLSVNQSLSGDRTLVSSDGSFEMGFFRPGESPNYYIGIWYNKTNTIETVVWVANRDAPISDKFSSELKIIHGNLVLLNESKSQIWSTNTNSTATNASIVLLDDGNLVLRYGSNSNPPIWQSFDHPTHTFLPGGKLGYNKRTNTKQILTSWKSIEDPGTGLFSLEIDPNKKQYLIKWDRSVVYWTSGSWNDRDKFLSLVPEMRFNNIYSFSYVDNENENYFTYSLYKNSSVSRFIIDFSGQVKQFSWLYNNFSYGQWNLFWSQPQMQCEVYGLCGAFGVCSMSSLPFCTCLTDYMPSSQSDWNLSDFSGGCVRKTNLICGRNMEKPEFLMINVTSLPQNSSVTVKSSRECRTACLNNCFCNAYSFVGNNCSVWDGELLNLSEDNANGNTVYVKVSSKDL